MIANAGGDLLKGQPSLIQGAVEEEKSQRRIRLIISLISVPVLITAGVALTPIVKDWLNVQLHPHDSNQASITKEGDISRRAIIAQVKPVKRTSPRIPPKMNAVPLPVTLSPTTPAEPPIETAVQDPVTPTPPEQVQPLPEQVQSPPKKGVQEDPKTQKSLPPPPKSTQKVKEPPQKKTPPPPSVEKKSPKSNVGASSRGDTKYDRTRPYTLLIASFRSQKDAQKVLTQIMGKTSVDPWILKVDLGKKGIRYRVLIGQFSDRGKAKAILRSVKALKFKPLIRKWIAWVK